MSRAALGCLLALLAIEVCGAFEGVANAEPGTFRVGSKRFTESYILGEIAAELARRGGDARVEHLQGLGGTALVFRALEEGSIDLYPDYTGTIAEAILHAPAGEPDALRAALAERGLAMSAPLGFENRYALAASKDAGARLHLRLLSDLAAHPELRVGVSHEFLGRSDGWPGVAKAYGLDAGRARALDHGLAYEAIAKGSLDVVDVYSTDAKIHRYGLVVLDDDRRFFPAYQAVFVYRRELATRAPKALDAVLALAGSLDASTMIRLNAAAELDQRTFRDVATSFVRERAGDRTPAPPPRTRPSLAAGIAEVVAAEGPRHLLLVAISLALSTLVGIPLGIVASHRRRLGQVLLASTGVVQTIPSLALLCFFIPLFGTGIVPALAALFLYGLLPIARNTLAGLQGIAPSLLESGEALGLSPWAMLVRVRLPLASGTILAGVRTSAVLDVGTATLAAFVGAGGFGAPISVGLNLNDPTVILEGAIPAAGLALLVEGMFLGVERLVVPHGLRAKRGGAPTPS